MFKWFTFSNTQVDLEIELVLDLERVGVRFRNRVDIRFRKSCY